jgi:hypothetical protein
MAAGTALVLVLALAAPASARRYAMNGTWHMRKGQSFIPLQFAGLTVNVSMGSWTEAPFSPSGQVITEVDARATQSGSSPATLMVRKRSIRHNPSAVIPLLGPGLIQITSMFEIAAPYSNATLALGGGPGSFTWCPANPACTALSFPIPGGQPAGNNGRVVYAPGANQFGGVMRMGLREGGWLALNVAPGLAGHVRFGGGGATWRNLAPGGGSNDSPGTEMVYLIRGYITAPPGGIPPQPGIITSPGPFITTMFGNTVTMPTGVKLRLPRCCTVGMTATGQYTTNYGFPHTTGTVLVQMDSAYANVVDFFSVMGSDNRTALGAGNLNTVAGGLALRVNNIGNDSSPVKFSLPYGQFDKVFLQLGPTVPSISPAGFAAAGALMLLAVGYALRRRIG